jgi:Zn-dependent protease with chaperone function
VAFARATFDFFEAQRAARRRTVLFLLFWLVAIPPVAACLGAAVVVAFVAFGEAFGLNLVLAETTPLGVAAIGTAVAAVGVMAASALKAASIARGGGRAVAAALGGTPLDSTSSDIRDQTYRNVVEEMAIASGLPVPELHVLREVAGINAFVAGYAPDRAVVAVTQGCLDRLTRDELQGIIGHELSHLHNGDTVLNLRMVSLIHGLTGVAVLGRGLLKLAWDVGRPRIRTSRRGAGGVEFTFGVVGLLLLIAGSVGAFFGTLITAAVSRQREFLADAASAQFTRDPESLGRALRKILVAGSELGNPNAAAFGHLFFASGLKRWRSTHPPIEERVRRLLGLPWDAKVPPPRDGAPPIEPVAADGLAGVSLAAASGVQAGRGPTGAQPRDRRGGTAHRRAPASARRSGEGAVRRARHLLRRPPRREPRGPRPAAPPARRRAGSRRGDAARPARGRGGARAAARPPRPGPPRARRALDAAAGEAPGRHEGARLGRRAYHRGRVGAAPSLRPQARSARRFRPPASPAPGDRRHRRGGVP